MVSGRVPAGRQKPSFGRLKPSFGRPSTTIPRKKGARPQKKVLALFCSFFGAIRLESCRQKWSPIFWNVQQTAPTEIYDDYSHRCIIAAVPPLKSRIQGLEVCGVVNLDKWRFKPQHSPSLKRTRWLSREPMGADFIWNLVDCGDKCWLGYQPYRSCNKANLSEGLPDLPSQCVHCPFWTLANRKQ